MTSKGLETAAGAAPVTRRWTGVQRFAKFGVVGLTGLVVNELALWLFADKAGIHYLLSAVIATQLSTTWNFILVERFVFKGQPSGRLKRFFWFAVLNNAWLALRIPMLYLLTDVGGVNYLASNALALGTATVIRFGVSDRLIWSQANADETTGMTETAPHNYDIHGIVRIASEARLPELACFRVDRLEADPDLIISISGAGFGGLRRRAAVSEEKDSVTYIEHFGRFGFAMRVDLGSPARVQATPLLRRSPHVLYTNVVEPVLRWEMVRKGRILAHAACLTIDGRGVLITARTDTGKTTTCLMSIKEHGSGFVSDDMVIIEPNGHAYSFAKPLTISAHTLKAIQGAPLSLSRQALLQVQSRIHSRWGRSVGLSMSRKNLPTATMNALVQLVVPPPKFQVQELVPDVELVSDLNLEHLVVIELGPEEIEHLDKEAACEIFSSTTEDAYGFPPYPLISHALANGEARLEADIRKAVLENIPSTRLVTPDRSWFAMLPQLLQGQPRRLNLVVDIPDDILVEVPDAPESPTILLDDIVADRKEGA